MNKLYFKFLLININIKEMSLNLSELNWAEIVSYFDFDTRYHVSWLNEAYSLTLFNYFSLDDDYNGNLDNL